MKLIVDGGATKTQWVVLNDHKKTDQFITHGLNPYYQDANTINQLLSEGLPKNLLFHEVTSLYYYGTGCSTFENCALIKTILLHFFPEAQITVHHDLYGAALALFQDQPGIACILGTGSNSCLWDGKEITESIPSLGYLIGDEGSGTYLGKLLLKALLDQNSDSEITDLFYRYTGLDFSEILHKIYKEPHSNRWIAGLSTFALEHKENTIVKECIHRNFNDHIVHQISRYPKYKNYNIGFVGSVAWYFKEELKTVLKQNGLMAQTIIKEPMEGLIKWHLLN